MDNNAYYTNQAIMAIDPTKNPEMDPHLHTGMHSYFVALRHELYLHDRANRKFRKDALKKLLMEEMQKENEELRMIGRSYSYRFQQPKLFPACFY